jgi:hypothetical protein
MNKICILISVLFLSACCTTQPPVEIPVFTPPTVTMPTRPILRSNGEGDVTKNIELDLVDIESYAVQLENIINSIINPKATNNK